ncbi:macrolide ABC transporter ATP-binding protein [Mycobacterium tuberculosis]|nr:macrolide ABC transporter ATP-binding protein [Mycobacterium tuberculosis]
MAHLLGAEAVHLAYPTQVVFEAVTLGVNDGARIGIVGRNGDGKSSLLGLLTGQLRPDSGRVTRRSGLRVNALSQTDTLDPNRTVGWTLIGDQPEHQWAGNPRIRDVVAGLVSDIAWDTPVSTLSGGQRRRVQLASLLVGEWDVIALDEPTNHLDIQGITWLADHLRRRWARNTAAYSWSPTTAGSSTRSPPQHGKCTTESSNLSKAATRRTCCSASSGTG